MKIPKTLVKIKGTEDCHMILSNFYPKYNNKIKMEGCLSSKGKLGQTDGDHTSLPGHTGIQTALVSSWYGCQNVYIFSTTASQICPNLSISGKMARQEVISNSFSSGKNATRVNLICAWYSLSPFQSCLEISPIQHNIFQLPVHNGWKWPVTSVKHTDCTPEWISED